MEKSLTSKVTIKGQVTLPIELRKAIGLRPGARVKFRTRNNEIIIAQMDRPKNEGAVFVERWAGKATRHMTTDEIMDLTRGED